MPAPPRLSTILVVEDNVLNMKMFAALAGAQGYLILQAWDGPTGLGLAREHRPDLIIMDWQLPGISGLDVTRTLKNDERTRNIPIVITTARRNSGEDDRMIHDSGCDGFLAKPIAISEFLAVLGSFLEAGKTGDG